MENTMNNNNMNNMNNNQINANLMAVLANINPNTLAKVMVGKSIIADLMDGVCSFRFIKADGSLRVAHGTLNHDLLESLGAFDMATEGSTSETQKNGICYNKNGDVYTKFFDINKREWRAFRWDRLIDKF